MSLFSRKKKEILLVKRGAISGEDIAKLETNGHIVILTDGDPDSVKPIEKPEAKNEGDGKAVYLDAGTEKEFNELKREDDGTAPWYKRLAEL